MHGRTTRSFAQSIFEDISFDKSQLLAYQKCELRVVSKQLFIDKTCVLDNKGFKHICGETPPLHCCCQTIEFREI